MSLTGSGAETAEVGPPSIVAGAVAGSGPVGLDGSLGTAPTLIASASWLTDSGIETPAVSLLVSSIPTLSEIVACLLVSDEWSIPPSLGAWNGPPAVEPSVPPDGIEDGVAALRFEGPPALLTLPRCFLKGLGFASATLDKDGLSAEVRLLGADEEIGVAWFVAVLLVWLVELDVVDWFGRSGEDRSRDLWRLS